MKQTQLWWLLLGNKVCLCVLDGLFVMFSLVLPHVSAGPSLLPCVVVLLLVPVLLAVMLFVLLGLLLMLLLGLLGLGLVGLGVGEGSGHNSYPGHHSPRAAGEG